MDNEEKKDGDSADDGSTEDKEDTNGDVPVDGTPAVAT